MGCRTRCARPRCGLQRAAAHVASIAAGERGRVRPAMNRTLLVTLTGRDRPGVTSRLFTELARFPLVVLDTEQIVLRGRLILGVLVDLAGADAAVELGPARRIVASGARSRS